MPGLSCIGSLVLLLLKAQLRSLLVEMHRNRAARAALAHSYMEQFVAVEDSDYDDIRAMLDVSRAQQGIKP